MHFIAAPHRWSILAACVLLGCDERSAQTAPSESPASKDLSNQNKGPRIAFSSDREGDQDIYTMNVDGSDVTRLTSFTSRDANPDWSPDQSQIAFTCGSDICVMDADGRNALDVTGFALPEDWPAWSPDGSKIAFTGFTPDGRAGIYVMNADGTDPTSLTSGSFDLMPVWSRKGDEIAFSRVVSSGGSDPGIQDIYIMNSDGSNLRNITHSTSRSANCCTSWSPSHLIAVSGELPNAESSNTEIFIMKDDGSHRVNVTNDPAGDFEPSWSPNGRKIAFSSARVLEPFNYDVFVMDIDGKNVRNLTANSLANDFQPDWSSR